MSRHVLTIPDIDYGHVDTMSFPLLSNRVLDYPFPQRFARWGSLKAFDGRSLPLHGFVDDWRIEAIWRDPLKALDKVYYQGVAIAPDYTVETDYPLPLAYYNVWRSRVVARYWQDNGIFVIPALQWSRPEINHHLFGGLSDCEVVAVRSPTKGFFKEWEFCARQFLEQNSPKLVLHFGTKAGFDVWENAINLPLRTKK
jgi:hypothetical protein